MITREQVQKMPTEYRDALIATFQSMLEVAERAEAEAALVYTETLEPRLRAASMRASGQAEILKNLLNIFK